jgi:hypothetical protein
MTSEASKLRPQGTTVILADGKERRVMFDMECMAIIEEMVGSISAYNEGLVRGMKAKALKSIIAGLVGGFAHYEGEHAMSRAKVVRLMEWKNLQQYVDALDAAWDEGVPGAGAPGKGSRQAKGSRGRRSTAASPSTTGGANESSGA